MLSELTDLRKYTHRQNIIHYTSTEQWAVRKNQQRMCLYQLKLPFPIAKNQCIWQGREPI